MNYAIGVLQRKTLLLISAMLLVLTIMPLNAAGAEWEEYAKVDYFTWSEYLNGARLLKESGPLFGVGGTVKFYPSRQLTLKAKAEFFTGQVNYDGQTQDSRPVDTDTIYLGFKTEGDVGWQFQSGKGAIEPFVGLGYRWWLRAIQSNGFAIGCTERWRILYTRLGIRSAYAISRTRGFFTEVGVKLPLISENEADLCVVGLGKPTVRPRQKASLFADVGIRISRFKASLFYEGMRFRESPIVKVTDTVGVFQPETKADIFGIKLGMNF